jgi:hypothetical protein
MTTEEIDHLAFSIMHGSFVQGQGGCSCTECTAIRESIDRQCKEEAAKFYNEHYPPPGGLL